jgi:hypothetical protein
MLESPWPILILGLLVEAVLAIALFRSGRGALLWAMGGVALIVLLGVLIERNTITDTKRVRQTLLEVALELEANRPEQVKACIVPGPDGNPARKEVDWAIGRAEFHQISLSNLEVKFNYQTSPATAEATCTVFVRGRDRSGTIDAEISRPVFLEVKLRKESGRWLIYGEPKHDAHE